MRTFKPRLARCWRLAMSAWARRWRVIRRDRLQAETAAAYLAAAIVCREKAKELLTTDNVPS